MQKEYIIRAVIVFLILALPAVAYADCTGPAASAGAREWFSGESTYKFCNGTDWIAFASVGTLTSCTSTGTMDYDTTANAYKFCDGADWIKIGCSPSGGSPTGCPNVGDTCSDGSTYAGLSPDGNVAMYTASADAGSAPWNNGNSSGYTTTSQTSTTAGDANTTALVGLDSNSGAAGTQPHQAAQLCADSTTNGQSDWYLPALDELALLWNGGVPIAGINTADASGYWSSSEDSIDLALRYHFDVGGTSTKGYISPRPLRQKGGRWVSGTMSRSRHMQQRRDGRLPDGRESPLVLRWRELGEHGTGHRRPMRL